MFNKRPFGFKKSNWGYSSSSFEFNCSIWNSKIFWYRDGSDQWGFYEAGICAWD